MSLASPFILGHSIFIGTFLPFCDTITWSLKPIISDNNIYQKLAIDSFLSDCENIQTYFVSSTHVLQSWYNVSFQEDNLLTTAEAALKRGIILQYHYTDTKPLLK